MLSTQLNFFTMKIHNDKSLISYDTLEFCIISVTIYKGSGVKLNFQFNIGGL